MTGYARPGACAHTGPAMRNAPGGSVTIGAVLPVCGSRTPMPALDPYAMSPRDSAPATGDGVWEATGVVLVAHAPRTTAMTSASGARNNLPAMESGSLTWVTADGFRSLLN